MRKGPSTLRGEDEDPYSMYTKEELATLLKDAKAEI
jgi:hypothetical protein